MKIIGLFPLTGNGGIASWTKKFMTTFPDDHYQFTFVNISPNVTRLGGESLFRRILSGLSTLVRILKDLTRVLMEDHYDILHTTTSGSLGSLRDYFVAKLCQKYHVKTIMHCRYGCIKEDIEARRLYSRLLKIVMRQYDQIWVLDSLSFKTLSKIDYLRTKVFLTPNSIDVVDGIDIAAKNYNRIGFVGNLIPSKGLYELVRACVITNVRLDIIGPGTNTVMEQIKSIAADKLNKTIFLHGQLPNSIAVQFMHDIDILALPTYYPSEAFPISIIEAMSLTKMVISCPRAAVKDILLDLEGELCGILVEPKSVTAIVEAINWCQANRVKADQMCKKAYEKVFTCYRKEVVYELYRMNYNKVLGKS